MEDALWCVLCVSGGEARGRLEGCRYILRMCITEYFLSFRLYLHCWADSISFNPSNDLVSWVLLSHLYRWESRCSALVFSKVTLSLRGSTWIHYACLPPEFIKSNTNPVLPSYFSGKVLGFSDPKDLRERESLRWCQVLDWIIRGLAGTTSKY